MSIRRPRPRAALVVLLVAGLMALTGCTELQGTGDKGYVTGDGAVEQLPVAERESPVELSGDTIDGGTVDLADFRGAPVVVTVWGSWCGPCRAEAPEVAGAADDLEGTAQFVGIVLRDDPDAAQAFATASGFDFPSIDSPGGEALLRFPGALGPRTIPAFVVLDAQGRIAASIIGQLPSRLTLTELVEEVAAEDG
ncbi:MAG: redoxin domain-containing protein [Actinobacteria bacterium]|uniref:Unannotated protein n=1 Tax=freshwater metagenome TaxID=449393 RepID=A0A6J6RIH6_9ZZZZ|nr:redoxin domain-containing protein [Actinomycetota bacterium]